MITGLGNIPGYIEQENAEGEQNDNTDLNLLTRGAEKYGQQQNGSENAG